MVSTAKRESNRLTAMKTISMRLRAAKTEIAEAGEETDGMATSMSELRSEIMALTKQTSKPVDIMKDDKTFKSTYDMLKDISSVYNEMSDIQKASILDLIAGKTQANIAAAILQNFDQVEAAKYTSQNSAGSALRENEKQLNSVQGRLTKMQSSFEVLSGTLINSDMLKMGVSGLTGVLDVVNALASGMTSFPITSLVGAYKGFESIYGAINGTRMGFFNVDADKFNPDAGVLGNIRMGGTAIENAFGTNNVKEILSDAGGSLKDIWTNGVNAAKSFNQIKKAANQATPAIKQFNKTGVIPELSADGTNAKLRSYLGSLGVGEKASSSGYRSYLSKSEVESSDKTGFIKKSINAFSEGLTDKINKWTGGAIDRNTMDSSASRFIDNWNKSGMKHEDAFNNLIEGSNQLTSVQKDYFKQLQGSAPSRKDYKQYMSDNAEAVKMEKLFGDSSEAIKEFNRRAAEGGEGLDTLRKYAERFDPELKDYLDNRDKSYQASVEGFAQFKNNKTAKKYIDDYNNIVKSGNEYDVDRWVDNVEKTDSALGKIFKTADGKEMSIDNIDKISKAISNIPSGSDISSSAKAIDEAGKAVGNLGSGVAGGLKTAAGSLMKSVGSTLLATVGNMALGMVGGFLLEGGMKLIDYGMHYNQYKYEEAVEQTNKSRQAAQQSSQRFNSLEDLTFQYQEMYKNPAATAEQFTQLQAQINAQLADTGQSVDLIGKGYQSNVDILKSQLGVQSDIAIVQKKAEISDLNSEVDRFIKNARSEGSLSGMIGDKQLQQKVYDELVSRGYGDYVLSSRGSDGQFGIKIMLDEDASLSDSYNKVSEIQDIVTETAGVEVGANFRENISEASAQMGDYNTLSKEAARELLDLTARKKMWDDDLFQTGFASLDEYKEYNRALKERLKADTQLKKICDEQNISLAEQNELYESLAAVGNTYMENLRQEADFNKNRNIRSNELTGPEHFQRYRDYQDMADKYAEAGVDSKASESLRARSIDELIASYDDAARSARSSLQSLMTTEDTNELKVLSSLQEAFRKAGSIDASQVKEIAASSALLSSALEQSGMNAGVVAASLERMFSNKDLSTLTSDVLALSDAFNAQDKYLVKSSAARERYAAQVSAEAKDAGYQVGSQALTALNAEYEQGRLNSNAFWASAELLAGEENLEKWNWDPKTIADNMQYVIKAFKDADDSGAAFMDTVYDYYGGLDAISNETGESLGKITKNAQGDYEFGIKDYDAFLQTIQEDMGISREMAADAFNAFSNYSDLGIVDIQQFADAFNHLGLEIEGYGNKANRFFKGSDLEEYGSYMGLAGKRMQEFKKQVASLEGVNVIDANTQSAEELVSTLEKAGALSRNDQGQITSSDKKILDFLEAGEFSKQEQASIMAKIADFFKDPAKVKVEADTADADGKLDETGNKVDGLNGKDANVDISVDGDTSKIGETESELADLDGSEANVNINVNKNGDEKEPEATPIAPQKEIEDAQKKYQAQHHIELDGLEGSKTSKSTQKQKYQGSYRDAKREFEKAAKNQRLIEQTASAIKKRNQAMRDGLPTGNEVTDPGNINKILPNTKNEIRASTQRATNRMLTDGMAGDNKVAKSSQQLADNLAGAASASKQTNTNLAQSNAELKRGFTTIESSSKSDKSLASSLFGAFSSGSLATLMGGMFSGAGGNILDAIKSSIFMKTEAAGGDGYVAEPKVNTSGIDKVTEKVKTAKQAMTQLNDGLEGGLNYRVDVDTSKLDEASSKADELNGKDANVNVTSSGDTSELDNAANKADQVDGKNAHVDVSASGDTSALDNAEAKANSLDGKQVRIGVTYDQPIGPNLPDGTGETKFTVGTSGIDSAKASINEIKSAISEISAQPVNLQVEMSGMEAVRAAVTETKAALDALTSGAISIQIDVDTSALQTAVSAIDSFQSQVATMSSPDLSGLTSSFAGVTSAIAPASAAISQLSSAVTTLAGLNVQTLSASIQAIQAACQVAIAGINLVKSALTNLNAVSLGSVIGQVSGIGSAASGALGSIAAVSAALNALNGKNVTTTITTRHVTVGGGGGAGKAASASAVGTRFASGGTTLVGELGPELVRSGDVAYFVGVSQPEFVDLKRGDQVFTAKETKQIINGSSSKFDDIRKLIPARANGINQTFSSNGKKIKEINKPIPALAGGTQVTGTAGAGHKYTGGLFGYVASGGTSATNVPQAAQQTAQQVTQAANNAATQVQQAATNTQQAVTEQATTAATNIVDSVDNVTALTKDAYEKELANYKKMLQDKKIKTSEYYNWYLKESRAQVDAGNIATSDWYTSIASKYNTAASMTKEQIAQETAAMELKLRQEKITEKEYNVFLAEMERMKVKSGIYKAEEAAQAEVTIFDKARAAIRSEWDQKLEDLEFDIKMVGENDVWDGIARTQDKLDFMNRELERFWNDGAFSAKEYKAELVNIKTLTEEIKKQTFEATTAWMDRRNDRIEARTASDLTQDLGWRKTELWETYHQAEAEVKKLIQAGAAKDDPMIEAYYQRMRAASQALHELETSAKNNGQAALEDIFGYYRQMKEKEVDKNKEDLEEAYDQWKKNLDKQKQALKRAKEDDDYYRQQKKKRKSVTDIQMQLAQLSLDDSAAASKKRVELMQELKDAQDDLEEFEADRSYEMALRFLEDEEDAYEEAYQKKIKELDKSLEDMGKLYQEFLEKMRTNSQGVYEEIMEWNIHYGTGIEETIVKAWDNAYDALEEYFTAYGKHLEEIDNMKNSSGGTGSNITWDPEKEVGLLGSTANNNHYNSNQPSSSSSSSSNVSPGSQTNKTANNGQIVNYPTSNPTNTNNGNDKTAINSAPTLEEYSKTSAPSLSVGAKVKLKAGTRWYANSWGQGASGSTASQVDATIYKINTANGATHPYSVNGWGWVKKSDIVGYAKGTSNAASGLAMIDEEGAETIFESKNGRKYKMFSGGEKVLTAKASNFLYDFATNGAQFFENMFKSVGEGFKAISNNSSLAPNIQMGDIIIQGNANNKTVSEIRRAQRDGLDYVLRNLGKLQTSTR